jgi:hypothetical protein
MKGDFTRDTFDPVKDYSRVLLQQGRVQLDSDWNEQVAILLHLLRSLAADVIGPYGGPGFQIGFGESGRNTDLTVGFGRYYVDGWLVENAWDPCLGTPPKDGTRWEARLPDGKEATPPYIVYLDVSERLVTYLDDPAIREMALGGPSTAARARVVWRLGILEASGTTDWKGAKPTWEKWMADRAASIRGLLRARASQPAVARHDPCLTSPLAMYRGPENQLYRVEIHEGGLATTDKQPGASFKWARDNGSVVFGVERIAVDTRRSITTLTLEDVGRDDRSGLAGGDWVELFDDDSVAADAAYPLLQVERAPADYTVQLNGTPHPDLRADPLKHTQLRRWDHRESEEQLLDETTHAVPLVEGVWLDLEDGVQVWFEPNGATYRTGDFWLIPARTINGAVVWPLDDQEHSCPLPPRGVDRRYAPLAYVKVGSVDPKIRRPEFDVIAKVY